ncbi:S-adenosyl-L-methionine-dependent methyltransferase [Glomus cerebriforme]|uniref:S-adenosyl-L-methionine-dependent methyltransferase n=1 Tax=Glomus cerebriforme TaxID=658196 RepID=A0A397THI3_9GLOM|nr:S-adenosyl-L-methionine-dependent methyltransferase [Glomus cerebriforme]
MAGVNSQSTLHHWLNYSQKKLLDFRPLHKHYSRRIIPSTCIPFTDLKKHLFELPPKSLPFAVLEPYDNVGITQKLLIEQGWNVPWIFVEGEELWEVCRGLGILEEINDNSEHSNRFRWILFQPSPFLVKTIDYIEESLKQLSSNHIVNCLDVACGNGRDVAWLSSRQTVDWRVTAVDAMPEALDRTRQLVSGLGGLFKIQTVHAKIMADGSVKKYQESSHKTSILKDCDNISELRAKLDNIAENGIDFLNKKFDLVISIRFLRREFLSNMANLVKPRGFLLISTFVNDRKHTYKNPRSNSHRLELGELANKFRKEFEIIKDEVELIEDGRPINSFLARKKENKE